MERAAVKTLGRASAGGGAKGKAVYQRAAAKAFSGKKGSTLVGAVDTGKRLPQSGLWPPALCRPCHGEEGVC